MVLHNVCPRMSRVSISGTGERYGLRANTMQLSIQRRSISFTPITNTLSQITCRNALRCHKVRVPARNIRFQSTAINSGVPPLHSASEQIPLTWNDFLALRKTRRRLNLTMSIICSATTFATGAVIIAQDELENKLSQAIGLDPIITMGLCMIGCGGVGWLIGPFFGTAVFQMRYRSLRSLIQSVSLKSQDWTELTVSRRKRSSFFESRNTESTQREARTKIQFQTTMEKRLEASKTIEDG
jgi:hypothetical protein